MAAANTLLIGIDDLEGYIANNLEGLMVVKNKHNRGSYELVDTDGRFVQIVTNTNASIQIMSPWSGESKFGKRKYAEDFDILLTMSDKEIGIFDEFCRLLIELAKLNGYKNEMYHLSRDRRIKVKYSCADMHPKCIEQGEVLGKGQIIKPDEYGEKVHNKDHALGRVAFRPAFWLINEEKLSCSVYMCNMCISDKERDINPDTASFAVPILDPDAKPKFNDLNGRLTFQKGSVVYTSVKVTGDLKMIVFPLDHQSGRHRIKISNFDTSTTAKLLELSDIIMPFCQKDTVRAHSAIEVHPTYGLQISVACGSLRAIGDVQFADDDKFKRFSLNSILLGFHGIKYNSPKDGEDGMKCGKVCCFIEGCGPLQSSEMARRLSNYPIPIMDPKLSTEILDDGNLSVWLDGETLDKPSGTLQIKEELSVAVFPVSERYDSKTCSVHISGFSQPVADKLLELSDTLFKHCLKHSHTATTSIEMTAEYGLRVIVNAKPNVLKFLGIEAPQKPEGEETSAPLRMAVSELHLSLGAVHWTDDESAVRAKVVSRIEGFPQGVTVGTQGQLDRPQKGIPFNTINVSDISWQQGRNPSTYLPYIGNRPLGPVCLDVHGCSNISFPPIPDQFRQKDANGNPQPVDFYLMVQSEQADFIYKLNESAKAFAISILKKSFKLSDSWSKIDWKDRIDEDDDERIKIQVGRNGTTRFFTYNEPVEYHDVFNEPKNFVGQLNVKPRIMIPPLDHIKKGKKALSTAGKSLLMIQASSVHSDCADAARMNVSELS